MIITFYFFLVVFISKITIAIPNKAERIENIFIKLIVQEKTNDKENNPAETIIKERIVSLCQKIFQLDHYQNLQIHLSKIAFHIKQVIYEEKAVILKTKLLFMGETIMQKMYSCYGRHKPIRTSYMIDNFFDKFYVSVHQNDSVVVYMHEYDAEYDWYIVYDYLKDTELPKFPLITITNIDVKQELNLSKEIITTNDQNELEYIYVREKNPFNPDPVCTLENEKKIALCLLIFSHNTYKNFYQIALNASAIYVFKQNCTINHLKINISQSKYKDVDRISQEMYPCFGRHQKKFHDPAITDDYLLNFGISSGPRKNSFFVYYRKNKDAYYLLDLFENVYASNLQPKIIDYIDVEAESPKNALLIQRLELIYTLEQLCYNFYQIKENNGKLPEYNLEKDVLNEEEKEKIEIIKKFLTRNNGPDLILDLEQIQEEIKNLGLEQYIKKKTDNLIDFQLELKANRENNSKKQSEYTLSSNIDKITGKTEDVKDTRDEDFKGKTVKEEVLDTQLLEKVRKENILPEVTDTALKIKGDIPSSSQIASSSKLLLNQNIYDVEEMFILIMIDETLMPDPVCILPIEKKISLCEFIFRLPLYENNYNILINKTAFYIMNPLCEKKPLTFKTVKPNKTVMQEMYPCYGKNHIVRSSFMIDNYYQKFYLSSGPHHDSVIIYIHEYDTENDWYAIHSYLDNIILDSLPEITYGIDEVTEELFQFTAISVYDQKELEYIYYREKDLIKPETICDLSKEKKIALCNLVFDQYLYRLFLWIKINKLAFHTFKLRCTENPVIISQWKPSVRMEYTQKMYPCFGYNAKVFNENLLFDKYLKRFYISSGSRPDSIFLYYRIEYPDETEEFHLFSMIENINVHKLTPIIISLEDIMEDYSRAKIYIQTLFKLSEMINYYISTNSHAKQTNLHNRLLKQRELEKLKSNSTVEKKLLEKYSEIINDVEVEMNTVVLMRIMSAENFLNESKLMEKLTFVENLLHDLFNRFPFLGNTEKIGDEKYEENPEEETAESSSKKKKTKKIKKVQHKKN